MRKEDGILEIWGGWMEFCSKNRKFWQATTVWKTKGHCIFRPRPRQRPRPRSGPRPRPRPRPIPRLSLKSKPRPPRPRRRPRLRQDKDQNQDKYKTKTNEQDLFFAKKVGNWCAVLTVIAIVTATASVFFFFELSQIGCRKVGCRLPRILKVKEQKY